MTYLHIYLFFFIKLKPISNNAEIETTVRYASILNRKATNENIVFKDLHFLVIDELSKIYRDREMNVMSTTIVLISKLFQWGMKTISKKNKRKTRNRKLKRDG